MAGGGPGAGGGEAREREDDRGKGGKSARRGGMACGAASPELACKGERMATEIIGGGGWWIRILQVFYISRELLEML